MTDPIELESTHRRVPAVTRAVAVLRRLGATSEPLGVNQLARDLGLVPSTCLHILRVLADEGLVTVDPVSKRYSIGVGILPIARSAIQRNGFAALAQPALDRISKSFGVTAIATQLVGAHMVVLALSQASVPLRISAELGSRFPALISATGRCVAAFGDLDEASLRAGFDRLKWDNAPSFDGWRAQLHQTRADGYGVDRGEYINGVTIIAVPFFSGDGSVNRSLVAIGISETMQTTGISRIAHEMLAMRDKLSGFLLGD
jgi:DNA-binding IclR family transcriptional regulator